jgi:hypothetical protein
MLDGSVFAVSVTDLLWSPGLPFESKITLIWLDLPGLMGSLGHSGTVQPHEPWASLIIMSLSPVFLNLKMCVIFSPSAIVPQSWLVSSNFADVVLPPATTGGAGVTLAALGSTLAGVAGAVAEAAALFTPVAAAGTALAASVAAAAVVVAADPTAAPVAVAAVVAVVAAAVAASVAAVVVAAPIAAALSVAGFSFLQAAKKTNIEAKAKPLITFFIASKFLILSFLNKFFPEIIPLSNFSKSGQKKPFVVNYPYLLAKHLDLNVKRLKML